MYSEPFAYLVNPLLGISGSEWEFYKRIDILRRSQGRILDLMGAAPVKTPSRVVLQESGFTLKSYGARGEALPVLLIVPATIKRAYIWDLAPEASVVRQCMQGGVRVFLIEWEEPKEDSGRMGLSEYADKFILECVEAIRAETGKRKAFLAGHSLGGTFAAIFSSLHPDRTQGLILLGAPLQFGEDSGDIASTALASSRAAKTLMALWSDVPGSYVSITSSAASPASFLWSRWMDWFLSLSDREARRRHLRVLRWMLDEMPLSKELFQQVVDLLYQKNRFMSGLLEIGGERAIPNRIEAPILSVIDPRCRVTPPESIVPFLDSVRSTEKQVLLYEGDSGVAIQHVGMLVGSNAHRHIWPEILRWIHSHDESKKDW